MNCVALCDFMRSYEMRGTNSELHTETCKKRAGLFVVCSGDSGKEKPRRSGAEGLGCVTVEFTDLLRLEVFTI